MTALQSFRADIIIVIFTIQSKSRLTLHVIKRRRFLVKFIPTHATASLGEKTCLCWSAIMTGHYFVCPCRSRPERSSQEISRNSLEFSTYFTCSYKGPFVWLAGQGSDTHSPHHQFSVYKHTHLYLMTVFCCLIFVALRWWSIMIFGGCLLRLNP